MAAKIFSQTDILSLLELEISMIKRFENTTDNEKYLSVIYFSLPNGNEYGRIFETILRQTDAVIKEREHYIAILYGTDKKGASILLSGIQDFLNAKPIDMVLTYPDDASDAKMLLKKFQDELKDNYGVLLNTLLANDKFDAFEDII
ncbi:MAG: pyridoxal-5'-phosphate-dependent protein [Campylobacter sp.]|nr:pyridoxal-5'-phosphate-dependent protein [Campylobacter sp.]